MNFNVTVSALNTSGAVAATYSGTIHFTSSDPQASLPSNSTLSNGTGTFSVTLNTAGSQTITATDTVKTSINGTSNSINVSPAMPPPPPKGIVGQGYGGAQSITIAGCTLNFVGWPLEELDVPPTGHPWSWSAAPGSSLPPGLAISAVSRSCGSGAPITVSAWLAGGVPTTAGTYNVILTGPPGSANYTITISAPTSAAAATKEVSALPQHHHYKLVEIATLGGPNSYFTFSNRPLSNSGVAVGFSDTSISVSPPFCFNDCFLEHTFLWKGDVLTELGGLPGVAISGSNPNYINSNGVIAGIAFNGGIDTVMGLPQYDAVIWKGGQIIDLGTFGGPLSYAAAINDRDEAVGFALNNTPASFDLGDFCQNFLMPTQMHAFIWRNGVKQDLGTLGGTDSCALFINNSGQATGNSFTNSIVNPGTGLGVPTIHPFFWDGRELLDIGALGNGTVATVAGINSRGQVAGISNLADDLIFHAFLWDKEKLWDFGTLGGDFVEVIALNEVGHVVGKADLPGPEPQTHHAFLAKKGEIIDLGSQDGDPCSVATGINSSNQVVGGSTDCSNYLHAFLWEYGQMIDLNAFVPPGSTLSLTHATFINDSGEIAAEGVLPSGEQRAVLLIPCDELHPNVPGCDYSPFDPAMAVQINAPPAITPEEKLKSADVKDRVRAMPTSRNRRYGVTPRE